MAHGSNANENIASVKSTCNSLECSPSHNSATSPIAHGGTRAVGHGVGSHQTTSKLKHGKTRPKPKGTHVEGKKSMTNQKSHGR